ncbi:15549_t:CDS:2 [Funneliformis geosporum]|uniref:15549_t:CDS:1 n=1 Tax=Funneliformis geosporum TaxID=1117311 RepID=A0A9W4WW11_9GLOM|nr:15549_t:CDS:2 [Funneliformis geosporum]
MTPRIIEKKESKSGSRRIENIDVAQLEYTATTMFTYGTIAISVFHPKTGRQEISRFRTELATDKIKSETNPENPNSIPVMDNLTKFKQRQAKTEQINHANTVQNLSTSLQAIQPTDNKNTRLITYALVGTVIAGLVVYHYVKQHEKKEVYSELS